MALEVDSDEMGATLEETNLSVWLQYSTGWEMKEGLEACCGTTISQSGVVDCLHPSCYPSRKVSHEMYV
jgi:hypothetical protein